MSNDNIPASQLSAAKMDIINGTFFNAENAPINVTVNETNRNAKALEKLKEFASPDAFHASGAVSRQGMCTPGTRTVTLRTLHDLATSSDPDSPDVVWMRGVAGAGKSAIMRTFAKTLEEKGLPLASFFFFRSETNRNTSRPFIPTLASQVWSALPSTQTHISKAIQDNHNLLSHPALRQCPDLLEKPLLATLPSTSTTLTIIVDGLDECTDDGGQTEIVDAMVHLAASVHASTNQRVKIFIASRPEYEIQSAFDKFTTDTAVRVIRLDASDADIHLFYNEQLDRIRKKFRLPSSWPAKEEINWLLDKTSGQYSFADVATRLMYNGDPVTRLQLIRAEVKDDKLRPFEALDRLYATILNQVPEDMRNPAVLVLRCRLHVWWDADQNVILEPLLGLPRGYIQRLTPYLSSLIDFDNKMKPYHASLRDFLCDPSRSEEYSLYVDDRRLSHTIQKSALDIFEEHTPPKRLSPDEEAIYYSCLRDVFTTSLVKSHPFPIEDFASAIQNIHLPSLSPVSLLGLSTFFICLVHGWRHQPIHIFGLNLGPPWSHINSLHLRGPIMAEFHRRTNLYSGIPQAQVDLVFGIAFAIGAGSGTLEWLESRREAFFGKLEDGWHEVDSLGGGWDVTRGGYSGLALVHQFRFTSSSRGYWRCIRAVLQFALELGPTEDHARKIMHSLVHLYPSDNPGLPSAGQTHNLGCSSHNLCGACVQIFPMVAEGLLDSVANMIDAEEFLEPGELVETYRLIQDSDRCWRNENMVRAFHRSTQMCLAISMHRYPFILYSGLEGRRMKRICEDLERKSGGIVLTEAKVHLPATRDDYTRSSLQSQFDKYGSKIFWALVLQVAIVEMCKLPLALQLIQCQGPELRTFSPCGVCHLSKAFPRGVFACLCGLLYGFFAWWAVAYSRNDAWKIFIAPHV